MFNSKSSILGLAYLTSEQSDDEMDEESISYLVIPEEKETVVIATPESEETIVVNEAVVSKYDDFVSIMPPEAPGECSPRLQAKIARLYEEKVKKGIDMNALIQNRRDFRNPSIYEKLITFCGIDEYGTNFPRHFPFGPGSYYEELGKAQDIEMDKRKKERTGLTKMESVAVVPVASDGDTQTVVKSTSVSGNKTTKIVVPVASDGDTKPKLGMAKTVVKSPSVSGNKATKIAAYGHIFKKAKRRQL